MRSLRHRGRRTRPPRDRSRIVPDLAAPLWRVKTLRDLPVTWREDVADVLGCEAASRGFDQGDEPNAYGVELGALFDALWL